jgi:hypothetical protein
VLSIFFALVQLLTVARSGFRSANNSAVDIISSSSISALRKEGSIIAPSNASDLDAVLSSVDDHDLLASPYSWIFSLFSRTTYLLSHQAMRVCVAVLRVIASVSICDCNCYESPRSSSCSSLVQPIFFFSVIIRIH